MCRTGQVTAKSVTGAGLIDHSGKGGEHCPLTSTCDIHPNFFGNLLGLLEHKKLTIPQVPVFSLVVSVFAALDRTMDLLIVRQGLERLRSRLAGEAA